MYKFVNNTKLSTKDRFESLAALMNWKDEQYTKNYKQFQKIKKKYIPKSGSPQENFIYFDLSLKKNNKKQNNIEKPENEISDIGLALGDKPFIVFNNEANKGNVANLKEKMKENSSNDDCDSDDSVSDDSENEERKVNFLNNDSKKEKIRRISKNLRKKTQVPTIRTLKRKKGKITRISNSKFLRMREDLTKLIKEFLQ